MLPTSGEPEEEQGVCEVELDTFVFPSDFFFVPFFFAPFFFLGMTA